MGISVSVDSWVQQNLEELSNTPYPIENSKYRKLIYSASNYSEILIIESYVFSNLLNAPESNLFNLIITCFEGFSSYDFQTRVNSATILLRIFPFLCTDKSPTTFTNFIFGKITVLNEENTPSILMINYLNNYLNTIKYDDSQSLIDELESSVPFFDLISLTFSILISFHQDKRFCHELTQSFQSMAIAYTLFDYINGGGRNSSIIMLVIILMNQHKNPFHTYSKPYIQNGSSISPYLCKITGEISDEFCLLCSLSFPDDGYPPLSVNNRITNLLLAKLLLNNEFHSSISDLMLTYERTNSKLVRCIVSKFQLDVPSDKIKPIEGHLEDISDTEDYYDWTMNVASELYLSNMNFLFKGTKIKTEIPDYKGIEQFVISGV